MPSPSRKTATTQPALQLDGALQLLAQSGRELPASDDPRWLQSVVDALLHRSGDLAPLLDLAEACESANDEAFAKAADALRLSNRQVNSAHLQALSWAETLLN